MMIHHLRRFRDIRTEKLRTLGMLDARCKFAYSKEALQRARVAYKRLRAEPDYRSSVRRRLRERCTSLRPAFWLALAGLVAIIVLLACQGGLYMTVGAAIAVVVVMSSLLVFIKHQGGPVTRKDENEVAREFDAFFASRVPRLSAAQREGLHNLGEDLSTLLSAVAERGETIPLSLDELRFIRVIVIEHLVNAVDPYLALRQPSASHEDLVASQIARIHGELRVLIAKLDAAGAQHLARSARFLERKLGS